MATVELESCVQQIGETAGVIWQTLSEEGPTKLAKLVKTMDAPRDVTMQAIGWLAREDKLQIEEIGRGRLISLRED